jgi:hypothetical protein
MQLKPCAHACSRSNHEHCDCNLPMSREERAQYEIDAVARTTAEDRLNVFHDADWLHRLHGS